MAHLVLTFAADMVAERNFANPAPRLGAGRMSDNFAEIKTATRTNVPSECAKLVEQR
jgi:hypothetical protein